MLRDRLEIHGYNLPLYSCHTLIIGSGAAALNCACHLRQFGVEDLLIVTEKLGGGVSNNSGSDKQTYYKLSLFGEEPDSVAEMARTLFNGGCMHGDIALIEAALSAQEFFHLVEIGVPFPHNKFGGYVGYKTDHDPKRRATSAGPWTSNQMFQKLLAQVKQQGTPILDQHEVISLLTTTEKDHPRVIGALAINKAISGSGLNSLVVFQAENVVMGTGGPGGIYAASVYPEGHLGGAGVALEAGATAVNLTEWQYGLASTKFRWNVSGSYQQVIPRYISVNQDGSDQREFLNPYFNTMGDLATAIFLKGYQWPFDTRKIGNYGSSYLDILVYQETVLKNRRVFMDFRHNPSAGEGLGDFKFDDLGAEAYRYLEKSAILFGTPIERLQKLNPMAIQLYREHGIDLHREPLEIAVCAQHCNGGLKGNIWWESDLRHLFPIGEVNGTHGVYRPGGSALNSGQVGGYRAAQFISNVYQGYSYSKEQFIRIIAPDLDSKIKLIEKALQRVGAAGQDLKSFRTELQRRMTEVAAHIRRTDLLETAYREAQQQYDRIDSCAVKLDHPSDITAYFQNRQLCLVQLAILASLRDYLRAGGGSRGSYLVVTDDGVPVSDRLGNDWRYRPEAEELRKYTLEYQYSGGEHQLRWIPVREIPEADYWFENVWREFLEKTIYQ
ncbi:MAG: FAD-binding protein [Firmicutes bacterium]|nr:FAD-binding protein [Bacillota bacterium]